MRERVKEASNFQHLSSRRGLEYDDVIKPLLIADQEAGCSACDVASHQIFNGWENRLPHIFLLLAAVAVTALSSSAPKKGKFQMNNLSRVSEEYCVIFNLLMISNSKHSSEGGGGGKLCFISLAAQRDKSSQHNSVVHVKI